MMETAQRIRIGLCSLVYRKSLRLNTSSLIEISNGRIVTIITKDVMLFESMLQFVNEVWIGTIQVIVMTYVMYLQIGVPAIIGIGFLVVLTPLQGNYLIIVNRVSHQMFLSSIKLILSETSAIVSINFD